MSLCNSCRKRQGLDEGNYLRTANPCFICNDLMNKLGTINDALVHKVNEEYDFNTFQIGISLPSAYLEREDDLRSRFRVKGKCNVKSHILKTLQEMLKNSLNKELDSFSPDLRINLSFNIRNEFFLDIVPTPVVFACKYVKKKRGMTQRKVNNGLRRDQLSNRDLQYGSLEELISEYLRHITSGIKVKFSWIGSEDKESLVLGSGRPFFAEVIKPKHRTVANHTVEWNEKGVELSVLGTSESLPRSPIGFVTKTRILVGTERIVDTNDLMRLESLTGSTIRFKNKDKILSKIVHGARVSKSSGKSFEMEVTADGGLHIKQFVGGKEYCYPNISLLLGTRCECLKFDIINVWLPNPNLPYFHTKTRTVLVSHESSYDGRCYFNSSGT